METVLEIVDQHGDRLVPINVATCLHRVAKFARREVDLSPDARWRTDPRYENLLFLLSRTVKIMNPQEIANCTWGLGVIREPRAKEFLEAFYLRSRSTLSDFRMQNISNSIEIL